MDKLEIKTISRNEALALNHIYLRNQGAIFNLGQEQYTLIFLPYKKDFSPEISIRFRMDDTAFWISIDQFFFMDLIQGCLDGETLSDLPRELKDAVFELSLEELLNRFERWSQTKLTIEEVRTGPPEASEEMKTHLYFTLTPSKKAQIISGHFSLDMAALEWFKNLMLQLPKASPLDLADLPIVIQFEIGRTQLSLSELNGAEKNDILLMDQCYLNEQNKIIGRFSRNLIIQGTLNGSVITIEKIVEDLMEDDQVKQENEEKKEEQADMAGSIDDIQIDLVFELGQKKMPLKDLKELQPGQAVDLEKSLEKPVAIKANNRLIGKGELVNLDNHIGVRIIDLFGGKHDKPA